MNATRLAASLLEPIPANRTFGLEVLRAVDGSAEVALKATPGLANVIGSLHSSGLVALIDAAGLAALIAAAVDEEQFDGVTPLGTGARLEGGVLRYRSSSTSSATESTIREGR